jgi:hypothetical protein
MPVTTVSAADDSQAIPVGPPPPFDAELATALAAMMAEGGAGEFTLEAIPLLRQGPGPLPPPATDDDLRRGGAFEVSTRLVPGPAGAPDVPLLICPMLDDRNDTPSSWQMAGLGNWDRAQNEVGWTALLGSARGGPDVSPYPAPARATDLSGLPPAFIDVGSAETFRDEDVTYATRIWQAGGEAGLHVWPGGFHGFANMVPQAALSRDAVAAQATWLRRLLGSRDGADGD